MKRICVILIFLGCLVSPASAEPPAAKKPTPKVTTPKEFLGHNVGDDYFLANYQQLKTYWAKLATESDRLKVVQIGMTEEARPQMMAVVTSAANQAKLAHYQEISRKLAKAEGLTAAEARALAEEGKAVVWIDGGLHASEVLCAQVLIETVYQLVERRRSRDIAISG